MNYARWKRLAVLALISSPAMSQEIDRKFSYSADLTGDGRSETIVLAIHGDTLTKPFIWTLTVTDREKQALFKEENDGSLFDGFFNEIGYMDGCSTYEQCKRRYYFEDKPRSLSGCLKSGGTKSLAKTIGFWRSSEAVLYFLKEKKAPPSVIEAATKELKAVLESEQTNSLCFDKDPQDHGQYLVWLKTVGAFVPYSVP